MILANPQNSSALKKCLKNSTMVGHHNHFSLQNKVFDRSDVKSSMTLKILELEL